MIIFLNALRFLDAQSFARYSSDDDLLAPIFQLKEGNIEQIYALQFRQQLEVLNSRLIILSK
ncbi:MAG: hypothetical protein ACI8XG_001495 [Congregibacter sp.]|jgi:hypothetical protein